LSDSDGESNGKNDGETGVGDSGGDESDSSEVDQDSEDSRGLIISTLWRRPPLLAQFLGGKLGYLLKKQGCFVNGSVHDESDRRFYRKRKINK